MITQPMLAGTVHSGDLSSLVWPVMVSPKIDGIRCYIHPELGPVSRTFKPIPNDYVRAQLAQHKWLHGMDGELVCVNGAGETLPFNTIQSRLMSKHGEPAFKYLVFDMVATDPNLPYRERYTHMTYHLYVNRAFDHNISPIYHTQVDDVDAFLEMHALNLSLGHEGTMIRSMAGPYKSGRSTKKQGWLLKYKEWQDAEGTVIGFEELLHNDNPQERDSFDHAKRSSHKDNLRPAGTLGALILNTAWGELRIGTGFDASYRQQIWDNQADYLGGTVTFKFQSHGMQDKPRFPVFKGFRYD